MNIPHGSTILITGKSGTGKSTLLNLIMRLWDPAGGQIIIDEQDIKETTFKSLRSDIAYCPQNPIFFNTSLLSNLLYTNLDRYYSKTADKDYELNEKREETIPEIESALQEVDMLQYVKNLPDGLNYNMGDQGSVFSGGEKQRLSIARALLKKAKVNLFDEPTNGLDAYNEYKFISAINRLKSEGKTTIIVTHNLNLAKHCDTVLYLQDEGKYEIGSHSSLLTAPASGYSKLYATFLSNYREHHHN